MAEPAAHPDPAAAGRGPAGRCDGIAGAAETISGPPDGEVGRLDRILTGQQVRIMRDELNRWLDDEIHRPGLPFDSADVAALLDAADHYRVRAVALESEVAALTDALGDPNVTHEFTPVWSSGDACNEEVEDGAYCALPRAAAVHRTPARVRAELEGRSDA